MTHRKAEVSGCSHATDPTAAGLPPLTVRVYNGGASKRNLGSSHSAAFEDSTIDGSEELLIAA